MTSVLFKSQGKIVGTIHVKQVVPTEIAYIAGQQADIREAIVVAENVGGDRIAVGDPMAKRGFEV